QGEAAVPGTPGVLRGHGGGRGGGGDVAGPDGRSVGNSSGVRAPPPPSLARRVAARSCRFAGLPVPRHSPSRRRRFAFVIRERAACPPVGRPRADDGAPRLDPRCPPPPFYAVSSAPWLVCSSPSASRRSTRLFQY